MKHQKPKTLLRHFDLVSTLIFHPSVHKLLMKNAYNTKRIGKNLMRIIWSVNKSSAIIQWIFLSFTVCVTTCESVSVSALMNSPQCHWVQTLTEQNRWDDSEAKHCSGSHHFSWRPRANIIGGSGWWSKITEQRPPFLSQNNHSWKRVKT